MFYRDEFEAERYDEIAASEDEERELISSIDAATDEELGFDEDEDELSEWEREELEFERRDIDFDLEYDTSYEDGAFETDLDGEY